MKNLKILVIIMTLGVNTIIAQNYLQDPKTGEIIIKEPFKEVHLQFDGNVPLYVRTDTSILTKLVRDGEVQLTTKPLKGQYSTLILYFTPKTISQVLSLKKGTVSYDPSFTRKGERILSWWYLCWIIGLIAMRFFQNSKGLFTPAVLYAVTFVSVVMFLSVFDTEIEPAVTIAFVTLIVALIMAFITLMAFAAVLLLALIPDSKGDSKKETTFLFYIYYVFTILMMVSAYYQV